MTFTLCRLYFVVQYKSLLDVTKEEDEEEVNAAIGDSPRTPRRTSGERPKSLDFSTMGGKLSIAGVTDSASTGECCGYRDSISVINILMLP